MSHLGQKKWEVNFHFIDTLTEYMRMFSERLNFIYTSINVLRPSKAADPYLKWQAKSQFCQTGWIVVADIFLL